MLRIQIKLQHALNGLLENDIRYVHILFIVFLTYCGLQHIQ